MATRYSGDVKVTISRLGTNGRRYRVSSTVYVGFDARRGPSMIVNGPSKPTSESYDDLARGFLRVFSDLPMSREKGRIVVRRTFQSPCPLRV